MLVSTIELFWRARKGQPLGLRGAEQLSLDWRSIIERKDRIVESWSKGKADALSNMGIEVVRGKARFAGTNQINIGGRNLAGRKLIIATGSKPSRPSFPGAERGITSDELIHLREQPARLVVVGGGFIGLEFGFAMARAGSKVTVLQSGPHIAPPLDDEIRDALLAIAKEAAIDIYTGVQVSRIGEDRSVEARVGDKSMSFAADQVLLATGRPSNVDELNLPSAGVDVERSAVKVNEFLQSVTNPDVYAVGDAAGKHQHTPVAWYEGPIAAHNALKGNERKADFSIFPSAIFTIPSIGQVGLTEKEARDRGFRVGISRMPFDYNPAAGVRDETEGMVKVVYDEATEKVLGAHVIGAHAEDLIQIAAVGMRGGLKKSEIGAMHYVFPTLGGAIFDAMAAG